MIYSQNFHYILKFIVSVQVNNLYVVEYSKIGNVGLITTFIYLYQARAYQATSGGMSDKKQEEMKEEIESQMKKKDYYQILGLPRTANDAEIKKSYRTLALRFHPDKNSTEGAKQVFKKVSHAYSVLIDPQKRKHYDQFGLEQEHPRPRNRNPNPQQDYQFDEYDDIFRMFFGGAPVHHHFRRGNYQTFTYNFGGNNQERQHQHEPNQQRRGGFNFYYIFLVFVLLYTVMPMFKSKPSFASIPSSDHRYKVKTSRLQTQFYATQSYFDQIKNPEFKRHSEMMIDRQHLLELQKKCEGKKKQKKRMQELAYRQSPGPRREGFLHQARSIDTSACRIIAELTLQHQDYIRDLTYMK